jgi:hypothetical protein
MDPKDRCHVLGRRETLTRLHIAIGDVTAKFGRDPIVEWYGVSPGQLDFLHDDRQSITIMSTTVAEPLAGLAPGDPEQLIIREARRRQRQRRLFLGVTVLVVVAAAVGLGLAEADGGPSGPTRVQAGTSELSPVSLVPRVVDQTLAARSAAFTFRQQGSAVAVRGSGTVNFAAPSYSIEETISGFPSLFGDSTLTLSRTPSGGFYEWGSGGAPTAESGNGLTAQQASTAASVGPMAILARSPAGYAFGLLSFVPSGDLRLVSTGTGDVGGTSATTYLFGDSGQCRGDIRTEVWTSAQGRILRVTTTQRGSGGTLIETLSLTFTHFGLPVTVVAPPSATPAAAGNGSTHHLGMVGKESMGATGSARAASICSP